MSPTYNEYFSEVEKTLFLHQIFFPSNGKKQHLDQSRDFSPLPFSPRSNVPFFQKKKRMAQPLTGPSVRLVPTRRSTQHEAPCPSHLVSPLLSSWCFCEVQLSQRLAAPFEHLPSTPLRECHRFAVFSIV